MNQQEILEYNKNCAELLGYVNLTPDDKDFDFYEKLDGALGKMLEPKSMKFHSDWSWIMEVVEAIEKLGAEHRLENKSFAISYTVSENNWYAEDTIVSTNRPTKEAVVQAINQFLIWYKENKI